MNSQNNTDPYGDTTDTILTCNVSYASEINTH